MPLPVVPPEDMGSQIQYLAQLVKDTVAKVEIQAEEVAEKDRFRQKLQELFNTALGSAFAAYQVSLSLQGFGSLSSGFAARGADLDIAVILSRKSGLGASIKSQLHREIPRVLEKTALESNMGARLLTRTRVPILKVCESPTMELYDALCEERRKWEELPDEEKFSAAQSTGSGERRAAEERC